MNIIVHREIPSAPVLQKDWNLLVSKMKSPEVFYTYEWALSVARSKEGSRAPLLLLGYSGGNLAGVAALATLQDGSVQFLCANTADYCDFVSSPDDRREFVQSVFAELRKENFRSIALANIPSTSDTCHALRALKNLPESHVFSRTAYRCGQVVFGSQESREEIRQSLWRKKSFRHDSAALSKLGKLRVVHKVSSEEVLDVLPQFFQAHVARFLAKDQISNIAFPERRVFLLELAKLLSHAGWLKFSCLMAGDRTIAWNYGFEFSGSWFWYQPTFDMAFSRRFPGFCLLAMIVAEASEQSGVQRIDLGLGDESYKARLTTESRETVHVTISRTYVSHVRTVLRFKVGQVVKRFPKVERVIRYGLHKLKILKQGRWRDREADLREWALEPESKAKNGEATAQPLTLDLLARLVMDHVNEPHTVEFALHAAANLKDTNQQAIAFVDQNGDPVKIFWAQPNGGHAMKKNCVQDAGLVASNIVHADSSPVVNEVKI